MGASVSQTGLRVEEAAAADRPDPPCPYDGSQGDQLIAWWQGYRAATDDAELRRRKATKPPCGGKAMKGDDRG